MDRRLLCLVAVATGSGVALIVTPAPGADGTAATSITVTATSDDSNGDVSSAAALMASPGPDGTISLREAIEATNNDPGSYTIRFASELRGRTIGVRQMLPALAGGGVEVEGDIDGNGDPDISLVNASGVRKCLAKPRGLWIASSGNRIHALAVRGFSFGVVLGPRPDQALPSDRTYANNEISDSVLSACFTGVIFQPSAFARCTARDPCPTRNRWLGTRIVGNRIRSPFAGMDFPMQPGIVGNVLRDLVITRNQVHLVKRRAGFGINVEAGGDISARDNRIADVLIRRNTITGKSEGGMRMDAGGDSDTLERLRIIGNRVDIQAPGDGIMIAAGDNELPRGRHPTNNLVRGVEVARNTLLGATGVRFFAGCCGARKNQVVDGEIRRNKIRTRSGVGGIWIEGGHGADKPSQRATSRNRVRRVLIVANRIRIESKRSAGIAVTGAFGRATSNRVACVRLRRNRVTGARRDVLLADRLGGGARPSDRARGNKASLRGC